MTVTIPMMQGWDDRSPAALLVRARNEMLVGWAGPVVTRQGLGVLVGPSPNGRMWRVVLENTEYDPVFFSTEEIYLDFARAECRDRGARVYHYAFTPGSTGGAVPGVPTYSDKDGAWYLNGMHLGFVYNLFDPHDPQRCPDGSSWTEARVLAGVVRGESFFDGADLEARIRMFCRMFPGTTRVVRREGFTWLELRKVREVSLGGAITVYPEGDPPGSVEFYPDPVSTDMYLTGPELRALAGRTNALNEVWHFAERIFGQRPKSKPPESPVVGIR